MTEKAHYRRFSFSLKSFFCRYLAICHDSISVDQQNLTSSIWMGLSFFVPAILLRWWWKIMVPHTSRHTLPVCYWKTCLLESLLYSRVFPLRKRKQKISHKLKLQCNLLLMSVKMGFLSEQNVKSVWHPLTRTTKYSPVFPTTVTLSFFLHVPCKKNDINYHIDCKGLLLVVSSQKIIFP